MNLSRNWLNEFVDLHDITDKQFNDEMTLSGSKVETIERLDEPTDGLDDASRDLLVGFVRSFVARGGTVLVTTHDATLPALLGAREVCLG